MGVIPSPASLEMRAKNLMPQRRASDPSRDGHTMARFGMTVLLTRHPVDAGSPLGMTTESLTGASSFERAPNDLSFGLRARLPRVRRLRRLPEGS